MNIPDEDWKALKAMKEQKLNSACHAIMERTRKVIDDNRRDAHKLYISMWALLHQEDRHISLMFDGVERSTAIEKLAAWRKYGVLTDGELHEFSNETQAAVTSIADEC